MIDAARQVLTDAIADRVFPAGVVQVGSSEEVLWREAVGTLTFDADSRPAAETTPFDLASLTKPIATATIVMDLIANGELRLDERLIDGFPEWRGADREMVTVRDLLEHASGLAARLVEPPPAGRREFEHEICTMRLEYTPRTRAVYSDLGFILLGMLAERRAGSSLAAMLERVRQQFARVDNALGYEPLAFSLSPAKRRDTAPTVPLEDDVRRGRRLAGEVHDNYASALGGAAGHAGLFGTAAGVGAFAGLTLRGARGGSGLPPPLSATAVREFTARSDVPGSSRALAWDTMLPTSSCGTRMSAAAFGHVGFTGTSLWIDPIRDRYFVLLTNRACDGGTLEQIRTVRRSFHDALGDL